MSAADLESVRLLAASIPEAPNWEQPAYRAFLESQANRPRRIFVAEIAGELAGFIAGQTTFDICELESIVVAPDHWRTGVGNALLRALTQWASSCNASKIQLEVRSANCPAIRFYERSGFHRDGLRRGYYRHPEDDALLMSLTLPTASAP